MFRNILAASLRNLVRDRLSAAISIGGLAVAFAAAILIGVFVRDDLFADRFIPGHADVYRLSVSLAPPGQAPLALATARSDLAAFLKLDFPQVRSVARLVPGRPTLRHGQVEAVENIYWADPDLLDVLPLPVLVGDPKTALARPDGVVLTRHLARKYFGRDDPVGETLEIEPPSFPSKPGDPLTEPARHQMRVTAVLQDLPANSHLDTEVFASGLAAFSPLTAFERLPKSFGPRAYTYLRLPPGASGSQLAKALPAFGLRHIDPRPLLGGKITLNLTALTAIHYLPPSQFDDMKAPGNRTATLAIAGVGVLIVVIAAINFVSLMSARAGRRAVEVGVRKVVGAHRWRLMVQFLGEALIYALLSLLAAAVLAELLSPLMSSIVGRPVRPDYAHDPALAPAMAGLVLIVGLLAGLYPALVLSSFRPATVLKGGPTLASGGAGLRQTLVTLQFAFLIALLVAAAVIYRQTAFALAKGLDNGADRVLLVSEHANCQMLRDRVRRLQGVERASCTSNIAVTGGSAPTDAITAAGRSAPLDMAPLDFGLMELEGEKPLAGRFLSEDHPQDGMLLSGSGADKQPPVVINATAARRLGFATPAAAVGQIIRWRRLNPARTGAGDDIFPSRASQIVGVVPDFSMQTIREPIHPMLYYVDPASTASGDLAVRVSGRDTAAVLSRIARQAPALGLRRPLVLRFYSQIAQVLYEDIIHQSLAVAVSAGVAVFIACLGLFGLAAFTAEQRTKEIGIRKAMGASSGDIVLLLLRSFTQPILWANLIAWPVAWWAMSLWLSGFAYRVPLSPWLFIAAGGAALAIAALTVTSHAIRVARAKPIGALRYE
jgi:putative ABC transport system permease protein